MDTTAHFLLQANIHIKRNQNTRYLQTQAADFISNPRPLSVTLARSRSKLFQIGEPCWIRPSIIVGSHNFIVLQYIHVNTLQKVASNSLVHTPRCATQHLIRLGCTCKICNCGILPHHKFCRCPPHVVVKGCALPINAPQPSASSTGKCSAVYQQVIGNTLDS